MKLLVVSGFLGSGKTSLILKIARMLTDRGLTTVIVENEIGEIGIDGKYLRGEGLQVRELFGGCICCTLSTDLVFTLREIEKTFGPDWTIVEPTGLATAAQVVGTVKANLPDIRDIVAVCVLDAPRYEMLSTMMTPLMTGQVENADIVAVNKIDLVDAGTVERVSAEVKGLKPTVRIFPISADKADNVEPILEAFL